MPALGELDAVETALPLRRELVTLALCHEGVAAIARLIVLPGLASVDLRADAVSDLTHEGSHLGPKVRGEHPHRGGHAQRSDDVLATQALLQRLHGLQHHHRRVDPVEPGQLLPLRLLGLPHSEHAGGTDAVHVLLTRTHDVQAESGCRIVHRVAFELRSRRLRVFTSAACAASACVRARCCARRASRCSAAGVALPPAARARSAGWVKKASRAPFTRASRAVSANARAPSATRLRSRSPRLGSSGTTSTSMTSSSDTVAPGAVLTS